MEILYEDDDIRVIHRRGPSAFTLVTFSGLEDRPEDGAFWAERPVAKLDLDCIGFVAKQRSVYPPRAMQAAAPLVQARARPLRLGIGFSIGGYAAMRYGRLLGLTHALGLSPLFGLGPLDAPEDTRNFFLYQPDKHQGTRVLRHHMARWTLVATDPWDDYEARRLAHYGALGSHRVATPHMAHFSVHLLRGTAVLAQVLCLMLAEDVAGLRTLFRQRRRALPLWLGLLGTAALRHNRRLLAGRLLARAVAAGLPPAALATPLVLETLRGCDRLDQAGRSAEADTLAQATAQDWPEEARLQELWAHRLLRSGRSHAAEPLFRASLALAPDLATAHEGLSLALARLARPAEALAPAQRAAELRPGEPAVLAWLGHVLMQLGRAEEAQAPFRAALALAPGLAHAAWGLALAWQELAQPKAALAVLEPALRHNPADPQLLELRARLLPGA